MRKAAPMSLAVASLFLAGCSSHTTANVIPQTQVASSSAAPVSTPVPPPPPPSANAVPPTAASTGKPVPVVTIQKHFFSPNSLMATAGTPTALKLSAVDDTYGLECPGLGIKVTIPQGKTVTVSIPTTKKNLFKCWDYLHPEKGDWSLWSARMTITVD